MDDNLAVHVTEPEDVWLYAIDPPPNSVPDATPITRDGEPFVALQRRHWWTLPSGQPPPDVVLWPARDRSEVVRWVLGHGIQSDELPDELSPQEYEQRRAREDDYGEVHGSVLGLYDEERVAHPQPPIEVPLRVVEVPRLDLEDRPLQWHARLPWAVTQVAAIREAFPGEYQGVREFLRLRVEEGYDGVRPPRHLFLRGSGERYATVQVEADPELHTERRKPGGRRTETVTTRAVRVPLGWVPDVVKGANADEAWEHVEALWARLVAALTIDGIVCGACEGTGIRTRVVPHG